jgi:hypothetical protein
VGPLSNLFKAAPQLLGIPGVAAAYARMLGDGNPRVDQIADMLPGGAGDKPNAAQQQAQLQQAQQQIQQLKAGIQQMHQAIAAQLPKIEADKWMKLVDSLTKIEVARIQGKVDTAGQLADTFEHMTGLAHDAAAQAVDQAHQQDMAAQAQQQTQQQPQQQQQNQQEPNA